MMFRIAVVVLGLSYIAYRAKLALQLSRAKRAGDTTREEALRARSFWLVRWAGGIAVVLVVLLVVLFALESR